MTSKSTHPRLELNEIIHSPVRLSMMSALGEAGEVDFAFLRDLIEVSDSLLSKHISTLEKAGYVEVKKGFIGKRSHTWLSLTTEGTDAYNEYIRTLHRIIGSAPWL
ncbi:transcriptional regulator [Virgibacillus sp. YIM 98842]|uniref:winged helix-turn-helix domain-containing protein n=1 Tax=Virgibacillus sp. YIM 98842 TaxID=2663533 RepID=UPI00196A140D|nr:transcriptional regulator [Virgibacillus sp. YIM 98842]